MDRTLSQMTQTRGLEQGMVGTLQKTDHLERKDLHQELNGRPTTALSLTTGQNLTPEREVDQTVNKDNTKTVQNLPHTLFQTLTLTH